MLVSFTNKNLSVQSVQGVSEATRTYKNICECTQGINPINVQSVQGVSEATRTYTNTCGCTQWINPINVLFVVYPCMPNTNYEASSGCCGVGMHGMEWSWLVAGNWWYHALKKVHQGRSASETATFSSEPVQQGGTRREECIVSLRHDWDRSMYTTLQTSCL